MNYGNICKICGYQFEDGNIEESIEQHIKEKHFIDYQDYYEMIMLGEPSESCWKCGNPRYTISPWLDNFHLPCSCCIDVDNKYSLEELSKSIQGKIQEFQNNILRNRYYQYILSITPEERHWFLPKNFNSGVENLTNLKKLRKIRIDRNNQIFYVTNTLGTSREISSRNLKNLRMEVIDLKVTKEPGGEFTIGDLGYKIYLPEVIPFDGRHHSRSSILNPAAKRSSKRLKIGNTGECIKFWSTQNPTVKSILSIKDSSNKTINLRDLDGYTQWIIKFGILKTKEIIGRVFEIYNEIFKYLSWIEDPVFLLNSFEIPIPGLELGMILSWSWEDQDYENKGGEIIKLSIV